MTTATATAHHTAASSHDCLTESAPENIGEMKLIETVLNMAWKSMTISTLPPVPLYTHVSTSVQAGDERRVAGLQAREGEPPPARLLPCPAGSGD
jgi:hypothetical protein